MLVRRGVVLFASVEHAALAFTVPANATLFERNQPMQLFVGHW
jgi:hypothetical protein